MSRVLLVRHPPVARAWQGRCYGRSDMGWSRAGTAMARDLAATLARERPVLVVHSGLRRTAGLAGMIGAPMHADPRWQERDFGAWEGRTWHAIWRDTGDQMDRMVSHPDSFAPGGDGETTAAMVARATAAFESLAVDGTIVVVSHGGPIAAVRHVLGGGDMAAIAALVPACGEIVRIDR